MLSLTRCFIMRSSLAFVAFPAVFILVALPVGQCFISSIFDSISKTAATARDSVGDVASAGLETAMTGTRGVNRMTKFGVNTLTDFHANTMDSLKEGHKRLGKLVVNGIGGLVGLNARAAAGLRDAAVKGSKRATRNTVDFGKSLVDLGNKVNTGTAKTLRTGLNEFSGKLLDATPDVPIIKPILTLPHNMADITLETLHNVSEDGAENLKGLMDTVRPEDEPNGEN